MPSRSTRSAVFWRPSAACGVSVQARVAEHQREAAGNTCAELERDVAAHRKPAEHDRIGDAQGVHERGQVVGVLFHADGRVRHAALAETAQIRSKDAISARDRLDLPVPHGVIQRKAVDQQHRRAPALIDGRQTDAVHHTGVHLFLLLHRVLFLCRGAEPLEFLGNQTRVRLQPGCLHFVFHRLTMVALGEVDVSQGVEEGGRIGAQLKALFRVIEGLVEITFGVCDQPSEFVVAGRVLFVRNDAVVVADRFLDSIARVLLLSRRRIPGSKQ